ncbi:unnamed protein product [Durusdinium trenchii]|uniref:WW domain-containing protein n=1 Tax=Durusdinium trenchii TaxID=1381693 RepID=A0ABP0MAD9_9DINO
MTEITADKRMSFIEFLMHLQAKEYKSCLTDLINLEFFPPALKEDKEALDIIVPTLATTLATLYEEGGDLKKKREMFAKQREEMKEAGKLDGLREKLQAISKKYAGAFRLPPYFTLILRAFSTLEGLGLKSDENFAIVKECFPYIARRLIVDDSFRMREALRSYLYKGRSRIAVSRIDELSSGFGNFTNLMKGSRSESAAAGGVRAPATTGPAAGHAEGGAERSSARPQLDSASREIAEVIFSAEGNFLQDLLIDEGVAAIDALSRATLLQLLRNLGPLALPLTLPLNFLLGGSSGSRLLSREDKESLLVIRRIVQLVDASRDANSDDEGADLGQTVQRLQRLQPLAQGLLPSITPGAASFAQRFARQLARRILLRLADDVERRELGPGCLRERDGASLTLGRRVLLVRSELTRQKTLAQGMLELPLPPDWKKKQGYKGRPYYFHRLTGDTSSSHPQLTLFKSIMEEVTSWPPDGAPQELARRSERHLRTAHVAALKVLSQWSGPHCMEGGSRPDRPLPVDVRDVYFYNCSDGCVSRCLVSTATPPGARAAPGLLRERPLRFDLQQRQELLNTAMALFPLRGSWVWWGAAWQRYFMILWDIGRLAAGLKCGLVTACEELTIHEHMNFFTDFSSLEHVHAMGVADGAMRMHVDSKLREALLAQFLKLTTEHTTLLRMC